MNLYYAFIFASYMAIMNIIFLLSAFMMTIFLLSAMFCYVTITASSVSLISQNIFVITADNVMIKTLQLPHHYILMWIAIALIHSNYFFAYCRLIVILLHVPPFPL